MLFYSEGLIFSLLHRAFSAKNIKTENFGQKEKKRERIVLDKTCKQIDEHEKYFYFCYKNLVHIWEDINVEFDCTIT